MGIFGKPDIGKLKSKGDVKALHKVLVSRASQVSHDQSPVSLELVTDSALALLDLDATDVLLEALHHELSVYCIEEISKAFVEDGNESAELVERRHEKARPILYDLWLNYENPHDGVFAEMRTAVRKQVRSDLSKLPCAGLDARTVAALVAELRDRTSSLRVAAARDLRGVRDADAVAALVACLGDSNESVRLAAAKALEGIDDAEAKAALVADLRDKSPGSRLTAIEALGALGRAEAVEPIADLLTDPDPRVPSAAAAPWPASGTGAVVTS